MNRYRRGPDGKTAYELRKGRRFARALQYLAEKILFMIPGVTKGVARVEPRWEDGIFLGVSDRSDELYVGTERGMHKVRTVRRREAIERFDLTFLNTVTARPWDGPKSAKEVRVDVSSPAAVAEAEAIGRTRRLNISKVDIMKYGLTEGCLGLAEGKRAQGHSEGCRARLEAEIAKTEEGRIRLTTAYLRGLDRESTGAPGAVPAPPNPDVQDIPMDTAGTSRKRSAEDAGHVMDVADFGCAQPEPSSVADDSMQEARREAEALGADAVALAEAYSPARFQQRAGAFGLSAGVAMDLRLGWDLGREADQIKAQKRLSDEKPYLLILSPMCLAFSQLQAHNTKPERLAGLLEEGRRHLEFACGLAESQIEQGGRVLFEHP